MCRNKTHTHTHTHTHDVVATDEFDEFETLSDMDRRYEEEMLGCGLGYFDA